MSVTDIDEMGVEPAALDTADLAYELIDLDTQLTALTARWMSLLAEFDRREGWRNDGQLSCVDWLVWRCGMSRKTAYERLRVAHELTRRPEVRARFESGSLSYAKVRAITRIKGADAETDQHLLDAADAGTAVDLERLARAFEQLREQERGIEDYLRRFERRGITASRTYDGMMVIQKVFTLEEGEEYLAALEAASDSPAGESSTGQRRADADMALIRAGRASIDKPGYIDRYTVHVVADLDALLVGVGKAELIDGSPIAIETLRRISCDCGIVRHLMKGGSEPLDIGTRTSVWTTAQRRAIQVRDHGHCRWPGCHRRTCDCHHVVHCADGGPTAVHNGCLLCPQHHTCTHEGGFLVSGDADDTLTFVRPDGTILGRSAASYRQAA